MDKSVKRFSLKNVFTIIIVALLLVVACVYYFHNARSDKSYDGSNRGSFVFGKEKSVASGDEMTVHFLDVGQGEGIYISFPDGKNMLIDGGSGDGADKVTEYLDDLGVEKIDLVLATHSHEDHVGALPAVFKKYEVSYCLRPMVYYSGNDRVKLRGDFNLPSKIDSAATSDTPYYMNFLEAVSAEKCGWSYFYKDSDFCQSFVFDGGEYSYKFDFLTPVAAVPEIAYEDLNDYSPICVLSYGDFSLMLTGDAERVTENEFLNYYRNVGYPDVDVLSVGHHGSSTSSSYDFIRAIKSEYAVISCGKDNEYGHPTRETLDRLRGNIVYRTDLHGNVVIKVKSDGRFSFSPSIEEILGV